MVCKRKRGAEATLGTAKRRRCHQQTQALRLTRSNLARLNRQSWAETLLARSLPAPFGFMMSQMPTTPSPSKKSGSGSSKPSTSITKAGTILDIYRIYLDRNTPMPDDLRKLVSPLRDKRGIDMTPKSKFIRDCGQVVMKTRQEDMHYIC